MAADAVIETIAAYVDHPPDFSPQAYETAYLDLLDAVGCGLLALQYPQCRRLLGPLVPGATLPNGCHVPGLPFRLDPIQAAFNIGAMNRWLDYNDTFLAAEWGHPSDNFAAVLAAAEWSSLQRMQRGEPPWTIKDVLTAEIEAHEIQGVLSLNTSLNRVGLDHVLFVKIASTAVATHLLGGDEGAVRRALSQAFIDNGSLRTYRHAPNTGSRKSWAAGDAASRGVRLALLTLSGEMGYETPLTASQWGFEDVVLHGAPLTLAQPLGNYVMEHVLFKISFPAEFHGQTAVEAAIQLHPLVRDRIGEIARIRIDTQESALRIITKSGPLYNPADRDHCIQYMTAVALLDGKLTAEDYLDARAADPRIDALREKMEVVEDPQYSRDYLDPDKRSISNAVQVFFKDGSSTPRVEVEYPIGHPRRRKEGMPLLWEKFENNLRSWFAAERAEMLLDQCRDRERLLQSNVVTWMEQLSGF